MLQRGRALRPWSMSRWLEGRHPDPFEWDIARLGLVKPSRSCAHGLQSHPRWSLKVDRLDGQEISGTLH